jgi:nucleotide-binding universal stress UspA family protein
MAARRDWKDMLERRNASPNSALAAEPRHESTTKEVLIENIIVPLDGSKGSRSALPVGRALARLYGATLHVIYVEPGGGERHPRQALRELGLSSDGIRGVVMDHLHGDAPSAILDSARKLRSALLVMCSHNGAHPESGIGPVAEAVLSGTPERVVLVLPEYASEDWQLRRILLAHDGTRSSDAAIAPAADLAHRSGAEVLAMHVGARSCPESEELGSLPAPRYMDQPHHEWPAWTNEFLDRMMAPGASPSTSGAHTAHFRSAAPRVKFELLVTGGQPGSEIAQYTRDNGVSLLVVAWRGRWEEERSETLKVLIRRSGCPVLLVYAAGEFSGKEEGE